MVNIFDKTLYQALANKALGYARENPILDLIPKVVLPLDMDQYKKPIYGASEGVRGGRPAVDGDLMLTAKSTLTFDLQDVYATLYWDKYDMMKEGKYLQQQKDEQLMEWARQANMSLFKGVYSQGYSAPATAATGSAGQGVKLIDGILDDAGAVVNLDGVDSTLTTAGDVYKALTKMVQSIPFRYVAGKEIILGMTPHFFDMANSSTFTNDSGLTEWEQFIRLHNTPTSPYKVSEKIIFSDDLFKYGTDITNTNDRLFAMIPSANVVERVYSRGFSMLGETTNSIGGITQTWSVKEAGCVIDSNAVLFSEQIAWA